MSPMQEDECVKECFDMLIAGDETWPQKVAGLPQEQAMNILCRVLTRFCQWITGPI